MASQLKTEISDSRDSASEGFPGSPTREHSAVFEREDERVSEWEDKQRREAVSSLPSGDSGSRIIFSRKAVNGFTEV